MTTIRLGVGDDAVEVEDGASVPLCNGSVSITERGVLRTVDNRPAVTWYENTHPRIGFVGELGLIAFSGFSIDLPALRRERAPKPEVNGAWVIAAEREAGRPMLHAHIKGSPVADYWTWRPFNTPEKQEAFDGAVEAMLACPSDDPWRMVEFRDRFAPFARALGYGSGK